MLEATWENVLEHVAGASDDHWVKCADQHNPWQQSRRGIGEALHPAEWQDVIELRYGMDALRDGPLHHAAQAGDVRRVARLLAEGAAVDARNYRMYTPLHVAAGMGLPRSSRCWWRPAPTPGPSRHSSPRRCMKRGGSLHRTINALAPARPARK
jgi:hypothetical protein